MVSMPEMFMPLTLRSSLILPMMPCVSSKSDTAGFEEDKVFFDCHRDGFFVAYCYFVDLVEEGVDVFFLGNVEDD